MDAAETDTKDSFGEFVDRREEISLVYDKLASFADRLAHPSVIIFKGISGIGKSALIREIRWRLSRDGVRSTLIDFSSERYTDSTTQLRNLLEDLLNQLPARENPQNSPNVEELEHLWKLESTDFINGLRAKPLVMCFDTFEKCDYKTLRGLEDNILRPTLKTGKAVIIIASRISIGWQRPEIVQILVEHELKPFTEATTGDQTRQESDTAQQIQQWSYGIPSVNAAIDWETELASDVNPDQRKLHILRKVVDVIFSGSTISNEVRVAIKYASVLRQFDSGSLGELLKTAQPDIWEAKSNREFRALITEMLASTYAEWNRERRGYVIVKPVRQILEESLRAENEGSDGIFDRLHTKAYEICKGRIDEIPSYLADALYHKVQSRSHNTDVKDLGRWFAEKLNKIVYYRKGRARQDMDTILHEFDDEDIKLKLSSDEMGMVRDALKDQLTQLDESLQADPIKRNSI